LTDRAVIEFRTEIEVNPYDASNYLALASLSSGDGKWQDATSALERAHSVDSSSPYIKNNLAYLYLQHGGDPNAALSLAQDAKHALPDSPVVADTLGWAFYSVGSYAPAITQLSMSAQKHPDNPEYQYHLGMAYLGTGRFEPAAQSLQRALKTSSNFADAESAKAALDTIAKRQRQ
jgi:tetratricopeptide (TPR) repeat protein